METKARPAVFLDRDGVLNREISLDVVPSDPRKELEMFRWVPAALTSLAKRGFELVVVSNQTVVARGLLSRQGMEALNGRLFTHIAAQGGPNLVHYFYCPHHPSATLSAYRCVCDCRKPRPGMLRQAAAKLGLDLGRSFMIGDRITDILAGRAAGCRTILVESGAHRLPPIETTDPIDLTAPGATPDFIFPTLKEAAAWLAPSSEVAA